MYVKLHVISKSYIMITRKQILVDLEKLSK